MPIAFASAFGSSAAFSRLSDKAADSACRLSHVLSPAALGLLVAPIKMLVDLSWCEAGEICGIIVNLVSNTGHCVGVRPAVQCGRRGVRAPRVRLCILLLFWWGMCGTAT